MEIIENIAGLGKDHDKESRENDLAKKQSEAQPGAENLEMEPHSVNQNGDKGFSNSNPSKEDEPAIHEQADEYAKDEHEKAADWENPNETGPESPQF